MASKHYVKVVLLKELKCFRCREVKTINNFFRDSSSKTGVKAFCKSCENKKSSDFDKPGYIRCLNCDEYKEISCFNIDSRKKSGRKSTCSDCISIKNGRKRYRYGKKECPNCNIEKFHKEFGTKHQIKGEKVVYFDICRVCRDKDKEVEEGYKRCGRCKEVFPFENFYKYKTSSTGYASSCIPCSSELRKLSNVNVELRRNTNLLTMYGITSARYDALLEDQMGSCALPSCGITPEINGKALAVDHDHSCCPGRKSCGDCVRGLLCSTHNFMLGYAHDNPKELLDGVDYLERYSSSK